MAEGTKKGANKIKRAGSRKTKIAHYYMTTYPRHKIRRILKNNGVPHAQSWADTHGFIALFRTMVHEMGVETDRPGVPEAT